MAYTVKQLAHISGVTVRTLHHYDDIGLLTPSSIQENGYRLYEEKELLRLQQILFFRELDFSLSEIKEILDAENFEIVAALHDHKELLQLEKKRIDGLIKTINKTIIHMTTEEKISDEELYDAFSDDEVKRYQEEVQQRWGNTDAYKQSMARVSKMTKKEMEQLKKEGKEFTQKLADAMEQPIESSEVQALIQKHYEGIQFFYDCPLDMYRNLGQMYVDDPRFTQYYDDFRPGLAVFVRDAIVYYCDTHQKKSS